MSKTETIKIDIAEIKSKLALFDDARELFNSVSAALGTRNALAPLHDLCKGVEIDETMRNEFNTFSNTFMGKIDSVKKYINDIVIVDSGGLLNDNEQLKLPDKNTTDVVTTAKEKETKELDGSSSSDSNITSEKPTAEDKETKELDDSNGSKKTTGDINITGDGIASFSLLGESIVDVGDIDTTGKDEEINQELNSVSSEATGDINTTDSNKTIDQLNGNIFGIGSGGYIDTVAGNNVIKRIFTATGELVAIATTAGEREIWYQVVNGKVLESTVSLGNTFYLHEGVSVIVDGKEITINPGSYEIEQVFSNPDGSLAGIRITAGDYKIQLHYDTNGNITKVEYIRTQNGVFVINTSDYKVVDMFGNTIDKFATGNYYIYDVLYDDKGNIEAFNLSPEGEYEKWLYLDEKVDINSYSLFDSTKGQSNSKASISLFDGNKALFGLLGVLFVALGTTIVLKKKHDKKYNSLENNDDSEEWTEESLPSGNYAIYDVKKSDDGLVTEARINPLDSDEEYWVEM